MMGRKTSRSAGTGKSVISNSEVSSNILTVRVMARPGTRSSALLAQAWQHLWLASCYDVYREFTSVHHTIHPAPSPPDAGRYTVPSRFRCQSGDCGYRVRGLCRPYRTEAAIAPNKLYHIATK